MAGGSSAQMGLCGASKTLARTFLPSLKKKKSPSTQFLFFFQPDLQLRSSLRSVIACKKWQAKWCFSSELFRSRPAGWEMTPGAWGTQEGGRVPPASGAGQFCTEVVSHSIGGPIFGSVSHTAWWGTAVRRIRPSGFMSAWMKYWA